MKGKSSSIEMSEQRPPSRGSRLSTDNEFLTEDRNKPEVIEYVYDDQIANGKPKLSFDNLYKTPQQYIDALSQRIPLNELYEVKDCFCDNAANEYCAVTLEVKNPDLQQTLQLKNKTDDRILKVYNKQGNLVYQRTITALKQEDLKKAVDPKYKEGKVVMDWMMQKQGASSTFSLQDQERLRYPYIAMFQNILIIDPREKVPTGGQDQEQSVLNVVKLDHRNGTKVVKLRFANVNETNSLDMFANIAYLDKNLIFLTYDEKQKQHVMRLMKLDIDSLFNNDDEGNNNDEELARHEDNAKQCVQVLEVLPEDLIYVPVLTHGNKYTGFIDIGYNIITVQKNTGVESQEIVQGIALIEECKGRINFQELQIKTVQKMMTTSQPIKRKKTKRMEQKARNSYSNDEWEPKVLLCNLSHFQAMPKTSDNVPIKKIVSRMYFTREENMGKQLHHSAIVLKDNKTVEFYNEFSYVGRIQGEFQDAYADFDMFYLAEFVNAKSYLQIECKHGGKKTSDPHIWKIPTAMSSKANDTIRPTNVNQLLVKMNEERDLDGVHVKSNSETRNQIYVHTLQQQIRNWVRLVPDFCQIGEFFIIAHDRFVSVFSNQQWIFHEQCPDIVFFMTPKGTCSGKDFNARNPIPKKTEEESDGEAYYDEEIQTPEGDERFGEEYDESEELFEVRVMYGLGKVFDLVWPRSMNKKEYRSDIRTLKQKQYELSAQNSNLPYRVFQPVSHQKIQGAIFFLTDDCPFVLQEEHQEIKSSKFGKEGTEDKKGGATAVSTANSMMVAIRKKEQMVNQTFKIPSQRSEIFFKFTGYNYKIASAWKITLSKTLPLLPFQQNYECIVLPKKYKTHRPRQEFQLWMITPGGQYKRIWFTNQDIKLNYETTQINLQFNKMDNKTILHLITRTHFTNVMINSCAKCDQVVVKDISYQLCSEEFKRKTKDKMFLRPEDFRKIQCGYRFHLNDREFEEDDQSSEEECDCKNRQPIDPEGYFEDFFQVQTQTDEEQAQFLRISHCDSQSSLRTEDDFDRAKSPDKIEFEILPPIDSRFKTEKDINKLSVDLSRGEEMEQKLKQLRIEHAIESECMNISSKKKAIEGYDKKYTLLFVYILDGRVCLLKPDYRYKVNSQEKDDTQSMNESIIGLENFSARSGYTMSKASKLSSIGKKPRTDQPIYNYLKIIRRGPSMNIRSAIDSGDEQDFIYALCDGFEETKQLDLDELDPEKISIQAPEQASGTFMHSCLLAIDIRHFANKHELNFRSIKPAISGVNCKISLEGDEQATLIMDNFQALGRQPTAHSNKLMFFSYPQFNSKNNYEMLIERQSQEYFEIVTSKNEIYKWEVLTGRLLSTITDKQLYLNGMKQSKNRTQHFKDFSICVTVKNTLTEAFEYDPMGVKDEHLQKSMRDEKTTFLVPIEDAAPQKHSLKKNYKPLRSREKQKLRQARYTTRNQKRVYVLKLFDARTPIDELRSKDQNSEKMDSNAHISYLTVPFWFDHSILDDRVSISSLYQKKHSQKCKTQEEVDDDLKTPVIKLTENLEKMLVVTQTDSVIIFKKQDLIEPDEADLERVHEMKWKVLHVISDLHGSILKRSRELFLFDPNFEYYFNVQYNVNSFVIFKLNENSKLPTVHKRIDPRFFNMELEGSKSMENMQLLVSRMQIIDDERIRIVSHSGLDAIYNYMHDHVEAYVPIEDFETLYGNFGDKHLFLQPQQVQKHATVLRLFKTNFDYRRHIKFMEQLDEATFKRLYECQNRFSKQSKNVTEYRKLERNLKIFTVEKYYNKNQKNMEPFVQQSFTLLDWIAIGEITNSSASNDHELISEEGIIRIIYNMLPIHRSFLEMLIVGETQQKINIIKYFFDVCNRADFEEGLLQGRKVQIPLMRNLQGTTALDWTLQMAPVYVQEKKRDLACFDPILAQEILKGIKNYELFTIQEVYTAIPRAIEFGIPFLPDFLEFRMKRSNYFNQQEWSKNYFYKNANSLLFDLKKQKEDGRKEKQTTYVTSNCFSAWPNQRVVAEQLFLQTNDVKASLQIDFRVLDIPHLHNMENPIGEDFIAQLCNKNDPTLFLKYSVSSIIQERFQRSQKYFMIYQFVPFAIYLLLFNIWLHVVYVNDIDALREAIAHPELEANIDNSAAGLRDLMVEVGQANYTSRSLAEDLEVEGIDPAIEQPGETDSSTIREEDVTMINSNEVEPDESTENDETVNTGVTETAEVSSEPSETIDETTETTGEPSVTPTTEDQAADEAEEKTENLSSKDAENKLHVHPGLISAFEIIMIVFGFYFVVCGLFQMLWPVFKQFEPWYNIFVEETFYLNVLPNLVIIFIFILNQLKGYESVDKLLAGQEFKLRRRQALGIANCVMQTRLLFNLKSSKLFGENLMVIMHILKNIPVFFCVFFTMIYVMSDFIWLTSNMTDSTWTDDRDAPFLKSGFNSFTRMLSLSLYGEISWLSIKYESDGMKIYYFIVWITFTLVTNVVMYNLLVSALTLFYTEFKANEDVVLKLVQAQTIQNMIFIERFVLYIKRMFGDKGRFKLRKEYFHIALHSSNYIIEDELPLAEKVANASNEGEEEEKDKEEE